MIRMANEADLAAIVAIYNQTVSSRTSTADTRPLTVKERRPWFNAHSDAYPIWVWEDDGIGGWLSFSTFYGRPAYRATAEVSIYVDQNRRQQGIGKQLIEEAIRKSPFLGYKTLLGFIFAHNTPSLNLTRQYGFEDWGRLPAVAEMDGQAYDLLILGRKI
jgi:L-amino acid N-acyltransferase YncA